MKQMRCDSCGAKMKVDLENKMAYCEYCGSKVYLNNEKIEIFKHQTKIVKFVFIGSLCIFILIFLAIISQIFFTSKVFDKIFNNNDNVLNKEEISQFDQMKFNSQFEMFSGTQDIMFTKELLQLVIINNKKNKNNLITVEYSDKETNNPDELIDIKKNLKEISYEIILDYDSNGFVNRISLKV